MFPYHFLHDTIKTFMLFQILLECFFLFTSTDNENIFQTNKFPPFLLTDWEVENIHTAFIL